MACVAFGLVGGAVFIDTLVRRDVSLAFVVKIWDFLGWLWMDE
jgi:hypothetical protein